MNLLYEKTKLSLEVPVRVPGEQHHILLRVVFPQKFGFQSRTRVKRIYFIGSYWTYSAGDVVEILKIYANRLVAPR